MNMMIVQTKDGSILHVCGDDPWENGKSYPDLEYSLRMWR